MPHIDWGPWIPTLIAAAIALMLMALVCDLLGVARRLTPTSHAFFAPFPPLMRRLWRVLVLVLLVQLVVTVASVTAMPGWADTMFRAWETDVLVIAVAMVIVLFAGHIGGRRAQRRRDRDTDTATEIGRGLGKLAVRAARSSQGKAALRQAGKVAQSVQKAGAPPPKPGPQAKSDS